MWSIGTIKHLNAEECRRRAETAKKSNCRVDRLLLKRAEKAIRRATDAGKTSLNKNPLSSLQRIVTSEEADAVWTELSRRGFKIRIRAGEFSISW